MALIPGTHIGPYEITAQIGAGGMGEVYRATDSHLKRSVAIKVLPASVAGDADRLARFQREAEVLAALNHPNIAAIYGLEKTPDLTALVMELVEGEDLSVRIVRGAIPIDEALPIAKQIADALEAAHEQGIVHRDLKPANIKVRADGMVKVLDFGLAKAMDPVGTSSADAMNSPTLTNRATQMGTILGTAAYMAPEQARGRIVDKRADIWAFGVVVFEMLTGTRAFPGDDITDTLAAVVRAEPDWNLTPPGLSPTLLVFLKRCLQKDPKQRIGDIHDMRLALDGAFEIAAAPAASLVSVRRSFWKHPLPWALIAFGVGAGAAALVVRPPASPVARAEVQRFVETMPAGRSLPAATGSLLVISSDGRTLVYRAVENGVMRLYRRSLSDVTAAPIRGTEDAGVEAPFLSPDGTWVGFVTAAPSGHGALMKVPIAGGRPIQIAEVPSATRGAHWGTDGSIVLALRDQGLVQVSADGGDLKALTKSSDGRQDWYPQVLPGGRAVLFTSRLGLPDSGDVLVFDEASGARRVVIKDAVGGRYVPSGHVVFVRNGNLWATRFDLDQLSAIGAPVRVEEGVRVEGGGAPQVFVSDSGTLAYIAGGGVSDGRTLWWVDRRGGEEPVGASPGRYVNLRLSPDGTRVALEVKDGEGDLWILDLARRALTRMTFDARRDDAPVWAPDGQRLFFMSTRSGRGQGLYSVSASSASEPERLRLDDADTQYPTAVSPNGQTLVFNIRNQIMAMELQGPPNVRPVARTPFDGRMSELSPDGRWLAYESTESGRREVYVRPYPDVDRAKWPISSGGANQPIWSKDGRELLFRTDIGSVMSVSVDARGEAPAFGRATEIVAKGSWLFTRLAAPAMAVAKDGRFLMIREAADEQTARIIVATNWLAELGRVLPGK